MSHAGFEHAVITEIIAQALEKAGSRDSKALALALREMTFDTGTASLMPGGGVRFDQRGGNAMGNSVMAQWQNGELVAVWPESPISKPFSWAGKPVAKQ